MNKLKNFIKKSVCALVTFGIVFGSMLCLTACKKPVTNFSTDKVTGNGGIGVVVDGYYYFINGATNKTVVKYVTNNEGAIMRYKLTTDGNLPEDTEPELVYKAIAGFKNGSLYAFGDYLYFATPSTKKASTGVTATELTDFNRVKLDGTDFARLYTTTTSGAVDYGYYKIGDNDLAIIVFEDSTITEVKVGSKIKATTYAEEVSSAVFASDTTIGGASNYFFYTKTPDKDAVTQMGTEVYRGEAGKEATLISTGKDISLVGNYFGYLYYTENSCVYRTKATEGMSGASVVSYAELKGAVYTEDGGFVSLATKNEKKYDVMYYNWSSGSLVSRRLAKEINVTLHKVVDGKLYLVNENNKLVSLNIADTDAAPASVSGSAVYFDNKKMELERVGNKVIFLNKVITTNDSGDEVTNYYIETANA